MFNAQPTGTVISRRYRHTYRQTETKRRRVTETEKQTIRLTHTKAQGEAEKYKEK